MLLNKLSYNNILMKNQLAQGIVINALIFQ
jgi:hypothetical protein